MATIHKEIVVDAPPEHVWAAIRDVGAVHSRLAQHFVVETRLEGDSRLITFANGAVVRERIVDIDDHRRRLAYSVTEWQTTHHNASFQVFPDGEGRARIQWITDLLPNSLVDLVDGFMEEGSAAIRQTLEASAPRRHTSSTTITSECDHACASTQANVSSRSDACSALFSKNG